MLDISDLRYLKREATNKRSLIEFILFGGVGFGYQQSVKTKIQGAHTVGRPKIILPKGYFRDECLTTNRRGRARCAGYICKIDEKAKRIFLSPTLNEEGRALMCNNLTLDTDIFYVNADTVHSYRLF